MPEANTKDLAPASDQNAIATTYGFDVNRVIAMRRAVLTVIKDVMVEGEHYGVIPGTTQEGKKPHRALLQPGAEVLCQVFRLRPEFEIVSNVERDDFLYREYKCRLYNSQTGELVGEACGSANSREERYSKRTSARLCPACGKPFIFKSKEKEGGWFCWVRKGGCGAKFSDDDKKLIEQTGAIDPGKLWDLHHTISSIAQKRSFVRATRTATACSDAFTDEPEDTGDDEPQGGGQPSQGAARPAAGQKVTAVQIQTLNSELDKRGIGADEAQDLAGKERDDSLRSSRLRWCNGFLQKPVASLMELTGEQATKLIDAAKTGKSPFRDAGADT